MDDQHYCLRWNNHQPNFISAFKNLLDLEELVDVTLSVEGQKIKAHKVILSACSPYFKLLFTLTPCKHPIVIMNDIKYSDLKTIVDFMYLGEVNVSDDQLADILEVAELLEVKGLYDPNNKSKSLSESKCSPDKKKKKKSDTMDFPKNELTTQQTHEAISSNEALANGYLQLPDWLERKDQSLNSESLDLQPDILLQDHGEPPDTRTNPRDKDNAEIMDQSIPHYSSYFQKSRPGRRRNSKVQESENFLLALEAVRSGALGFCKAAKLYGLNNRTLWLEYKKRGYQSNRPPVNSRHRQNFTTTNTS